MEKKKDLINNIINFIFSKKEHKLIILFFVIAFILRLIAAHNVSVNADEMLHATHAIDIIKSNVLQIMDEDPVWFYLTDLGYKIFGVTLVTSRLLSIIFGSLSIVILFLLTKNLFGKKIAIISSFLLTFSPFILLNTLAEMDIAMMFFILLSCYFFILGLKNKNKKNLLLSSLFFGIAILTKTIAATFLPAFIIFYFYYQKTQNKNKKLITKESVKIWIYFIIILFILLTPIFTFNYLLYKDKGILDVQFARFLGIGNKVYEPIMSTMEKFSFSNVLFGWDGSNPGFLEGLKFYYNMDLLILILFIIGIVLAYRRKPLWANFLSLLFIFPFIFLAGTSLLPYHFSFATPILCIFSAFTVITITNRLNQLLKIKKKLILFVLAILFIVSMFITLNSSFDGSFYGKNEVQKAIEYKEKNMDKDAIIVLDTRIYRGRIAFMFNDMNYIESINFIEAINNIESIPGQTKNSKIYFVECNIDDCGWGNIKNQPTLNDSMESFFKFVSNSSILKSTIKPSRGKEDYFKIYEGNILINEGIFDIIKQNRVWFYYPVRYKLDDWFDKYKTHNKFDAILDKLAHFILYISILIAISSIILTIYFLIKDYQKNDSSPN